MDLVEQIPLISSVVVILGALFGATVRQERRFDARLARLADQIGDLRGELVELRIETRVGFARMDERLKHFKAPPRPRRVPPHP